MVSYRQGRLEELLTEKKSPGRPRIITPEVVEKLEAELKDPKDLRVTKKCKNGYRVVVRQKSLIARYISRYAIV